MITARTKRQLLAFVVITLVGVSFVGARYARLDRLVHDSSYTVTAHLAESGGIFVGAEVTYRGVGIGEVEDMELTRHGVDVRLSIDNAHNRIPADTEAVVGNRSAVGEQYVELDPRTTEGPYLREGSQIATADTRTPVSTTELLTNVDELVRSVPQDKLRTVVAELGAAFKGTGPSLSRLIDTSTSFIETANQNFDVTTALIRDSNTVLRTQADQASAIRSFARDLELFTTTLAGHDKDLRRLIDNGSATASQVRTFLQQNEVDLGRLLANLVTTGEVTVKHLPGLRQVLVLYPYIVAGGYTVAAPSAEVGQFDAHFGLVLTQAPPVCHEGYDRDEFRKPNELDDRPMDTDAHCAEPADQSTARGAAHAPHPRAGAAYRAPVAVGSAAAQRAPVASYDRRTGTLTWSDQATGDGSVDSADRPRVMGDNVPAELVGKDAWTWMLLQPAMPRRP